MNSGGRGDHLVGHDNRVEQRREVGRSGEAFFTTFQSGDARDQTGVSSGYLALHSTDAIDERIDGSNQQRKAFADVIMNKSSLRRKSVMQSATIHRGRDWR